MNTTKKMPSSLGKNGKLTRRSEFVIPMPEPGDDSTFLGIKTGKTYKLAAISYIGKTITADDILEKLSNYEGDRGRLLVRLDRFVAALQEFKIGSVISISYTDEGDFTLILEAARPAREKRKPLP